MRFELTEEQRAFGDSLDALLAGADTVAVARAWAADDTAPGLKLWTRVADQGVTGLVVPEELGGLGAGAVELVIALEALGRHAVPGPWVESAYVSRLVQDTAGLDGRDALLDSVMAGHEPVSVAVPPHTPYAVDADVARTLLVADGRLHLARRGERVHSVDPTRRLFPVESERALGPVPEAGLRAAFDLAALACAAQLLGAGERLLADTVAYVKQRRQFGREIGSYQALKHQLADVRIALDFARPLVLGAALTVESPEGPRDVSAAQVAAGDAAYLASRVALQLHGAIGYTRELDLSLWILKVRALQSAWGTAAYHRGRVLTSLTGA